MTLKSLILFAFVALFGCQSDETISAYAGDGYRLISLDGQDFPAEATLFVGEPGVIHGRAPCNSYSGEQTAPYPWFETGVIRATRRACADLDAETAFLRALGEMAFAESSGDTLILSNSTGREMVFQALP